MHVIHIIMKPFNPYVETDLTEKVSTDVSFPNFSKFSKAKFFLRRPIRRLLSIVREYEFIQHVRKHRAQSTVGE